MLLVPTTPSFGYQVTNEDSPASGGSFGTTVTASGSTNTKGSWVAIHSTITHDLFWHRVTITNMNTSAATDNGLLDLGVGPDTSNVSTVVENLLCGVSSSFGGQLGRNYFFPLFVPAGTQLFARIQASVASDTVACAVQSWGGPDRPESVPLVSFIEAIGANTGTSVGTSFTPGNSGAMGSYAQLTASSAKDYIGLMAASTTTDTTMAAVSFTTLLGVGAATETELGVVHTAAHNASEFSSQISWPVFYDIPSGTRIAVKGSCTGTSDASMTAVAWGFVGG